MSDLTDADVAQDLNVVLTCGDKLEAEKAKVASLEDQVKCLFL